MAIILCIDTATENAFVSLHQEDQLLGFAENHEQKNHASFLHPAIDKILQEAELNANQIAAVAVSNGPGSYTGLRVGLATAKGLCYALQIPLICISTLEIMASAAIAQKEDTDMLYCAMIDARRMEVFTAVYDANLKYVLEPQSLVLDENSFQEIISDKKTAFFGNGSAKWKVINPHKTAEFLNNLHVCAAMQRLSNARFEGKNFDDLLITEPFYIKSFHNGN